MTTAASSRWISRDFAKRQRGDVSEEASSDKSRRRRLLLIIFFAVAWSGLVVWRLVSLQITNVDHWKDVARKQHVSEIKLASQRGPIFDRSGKLLAVSVPAGSVYVRPRQVQNKKSAARALADALQINARTVEAKLEDNSPFVWVQRQIPRAQAEKVASLHLPGVGYVLESKRFYPYNEAASTLIGKVGLDGNGLSGLESVYENDLRGEGVDDKGIRDALGKVIETSVNESTRGELPKGEPLHLTIDAEVQTILEEELQAGHEKTNAEAVMGILVDADTGEVLAMGHSPSMNFNKDNASGKKDLKNVLVEAVFEPGSVMKPIVAAAAIEAGVVTPHDMINCESGRFLYAKHTIKDVHPNATISFKDVVIRSSNIGMTKIGMRLGKEKLYNALRSFGFGESSNLKLPGETSGILRPLSSWAQIDVATHAFGQGVAVTPLQMVRAMSAIANGGKLPALHVVQDSKDFELKPIISDSTAAKVRDMLYGVVEDEHGTGKLAAINGVRVGGKTGTAQKARNGGRGYAAGSYVASFVGFVDASSIGIKKTMTLMIVVDEPHTSTIYGGALAAPIFQRVMERSLQLLATRNHLSVPFHDAPQDYLHGQKDLLLPVTYKTGASDF